MALSTFLRLTAFRANPQDLPAEPAVTGIALAAHVGANVLATIEAAPLATALVAAVVDTILLVALLHTALMLRGFGNRAPQAIAAAAGAGALLSVGHWLVLAATAHWLSPASVSLPFLGWFIMVYAHILRHALSLSWAGGVGASLLYVVVSLSVAGAILPTPAPGGE